ncbi:MAG: hypothetical protein H6722_04335 [Sandaracinus sp.]|nr:hypothetical protein [Sandaracinus sp.]
MRLAWLTGVLLLLAPSLASASETCVCWTGLDAPVSEMSPDLLRRLVEARAQMSREQERTALRLVGQAQADVVRAARLDDALSRPLDEIASLPPAPPAERVLWCDGSDDPRCTPGTPAPVSAEVASGPPGALTHALHAPSGRPRATPRHAHFGLSAHAALLASLERPPRV